MADPQDQTDLLVTLGARDLSPATTPLPVLMELLSATLETLRAIAEEAQLEFCPPALARLTKGSNTLHLVSSDRSWRPLARAAYDVVKKKGHGSGQRVQRGLRRMWDAAGKHPVELSAPRDHVRSKPVRVVPPELGTDEQGVIYTTTVHGRIVGLNEFARGEWSVRLHLVEGGRPEFRADPDVAAVALRLWGQEGSSVRATVEMAWHDEESTARRVLAVEPWKEGDLVKGLQEIGGQLSVDSARLLAELDS